MSLLPELRLLPIHPKRPTRFVKQIYALHVAFPIALVSFLLMLRLACLLAANG